MKTICRFTLITVITFLHLGHTFCQPENFLMSCGSEGDTAIYTQTPESFVPICDDPEEIRYLPIALHFILLESPIIDTIQDCISEGAPDQYIITYGNFTATSDGLGNTNYNGFQRAEDIVQKANNELENNSVQWRKNQSLPGSHYSPAPSNNIRYLLAGVYFHHNSDFYYHPRNKMFVYHPVYNIDGTSVIDVYLAPNDPSGVAGNIGGPNKFVHIQNWNTYAQPGCQNWSLEYAAELLNHEIGHTLSLIHTWDDNDNCNDTPMGYEYESGKFANCWSLSPNPPYCNYWPNISNNIMDYNQYYPHAYTLCQVGRINDNLASPRGNSYIHSCNGCMPSLAFFHANEQYSICQSVNQSVQINAQASWNETSYLIEICEVSGLQSTSCLSGTYYSSGWQSGQADDIDLSTFYTFSENKYYWIKLTVDNNTCGPCDSYEKIIQTVGCSTPPCSQCYDLTTINPFSGMLEVTYSNTVSGDHFLSITHTTTGQLTVLADEIDLPVGNHQLQYDMSAYPNGNYQIVAVFNGIQYFQNVVKAY